MLWTDGQGLQWRRAIPASLPDKEAEWGAPAGPPDLRQISVERAWPQEFTERLHAQLVARNLFDAMDVKRAGGTQILSQAIHSALRADIHALETLYGTARRPRR